MLTTLLLALLLLAGCAMEPQEQRSTTNRNLAVEILGEVDGCTIYRFYDIYHRYFVRCGVKVATDYHVPSGKSRRPDAISTETVWER